MNKILRLALVLFLVSAVVALRRNVTTRSNLPTPISRPCSPYIRPGTPVFAAALPLEMILPRSCPRMVSMT